MRRQIFSADCAQSRQAGFMQCFLIIACIPRLCQAVFVERPDQTQKIKHTRAFLVCFTMEEIIQCKWSGLRGSNSLPPPWQGGALPDELNPHIGASGRNRTNDTGIFSPLLYRLSYRGITARLHCWRSGWDSNPRPLP